MAWFKKRAGGRVQVNWRQPDGELRAITCPDRTSAARLKAEIEAEVAAGRRWEPRDVRPIPALREVVKACLADWTLDRAPRTILRYAQMLEAFVTWAEGDLYPAKAKVDVLARSLLVRYHEHLQAPETGRHLHGRSSETIRKHIEAIQLFWRWAWEYDDDWPDMVPKPKRLRLRRRPPRVAIAPDWSEMDAAIAASDGWIRDVAFVLRCTGLRVGQVMRLRWDDFALDRQLLHVRPELGKSLSEQSGRWVPLAPALVAELAGWGRREGWLIACPRNVREARARDANRAWQRAGVRTAVWSGQGWHAYRKGFKSGLRSLGVADDVLRFLCGHSRGVDHHYIAPEALPLREAVALVPEIGAADVIVLERAGE